MTLGRRRSGPTSRERSTDALDSASNSPATARARSVAARADASRQDHPIHPARRRVPLEARDERGAIEVAARLRPDRADPERALRDGALEAAHQRVAAKERADVPAEAPQVRRPVDLPAVIEAERRADEGAIPDERVERSEEPDPSVGRGMPAGREAARREIRARRARHLHLLHGALGEKRLGDRRTPRGVEHRPGRASGAGEEPGGLDALEERPAPEDLDALLDGPAGRVDSPPCRIRQRALRHVVQLAALAAPADHDLAARLQHLEGHLRGARRASPAAPVERLDAPVVGEVVGGDRSTLADLVEHLLDHAGWQAAQPLGVRPPRRLDRELRPVPGERVRRQQAALLREVLEGMAGEEVPVHVALRDAVHARERHEVGVGAERIERVELDAAEPREERADPRGARRKLRRGEGVVADQEGAGLGRRERHRRSARASAPGRMGVHGEVLSSKPPADQPLLERGASSAEAPLPRYCTQAGGSVHSACAVASMQMSGLAPAQIGAEKSPSSVLPSWNVRDTRPVTEVAVIWSSRTVPPCTVGLGTPAQLASVARAWPNAMVRSPVASGMAVVGLAVTVYVPRLSAGSVPVGFIFARMTVTFCAFPWSLHWLLA